MFALVTTFARCEDIAPATLDDDSAILYTSAVTRFSAPESAWSAARTFCNDARDAFQLLSIDGGPFASSLISSSPDGSVRFGTAGYITGTARVGGGPAGNLVLVGQSALVRGALPFAHDGCATTSACGACVDGFSTGTNVSFARAVEAGDVLQLAAIPAHFDGGRVAGEISFRFSPGGRFDFKSDVAVGPWDGVQLGDAATGCVVEKFEQLARGAAQPLDLATRGCALPRAPSAFRRVGGDDFTVTVDVSRSTNVPWSSGGLLVAADADDGSTEWLALRVERGDAIVFEGGASLTSAAWRSAEAVAGGARRRRR